ncbi:hypothetical protein QAD02_016663 [Eretmocerus hayati]|uniref:Uncharacterized protein n=1 Tax=Eretmocerus hayati TaxID=131215 RepID=A0ACC2PDJ9_9HYME|nr:hypothetical protein QAD02_016663 [Eretmocerus hayati]
MLRLFLRRSARNPNFSCVQSGNLYSTKDQVPSDSQDKVLEDSVEKLPEVTSSKEPDVIHVKTSLGTIPIKKNPSSNCMVKITTDEKTGIPNFHFEVEPARAKTRRLWEREKAYMKKTLQFWKDQPITYIDKDGKYNFNDPSAPVFPNHCDIVIIGGGAMGSSVAYWLKTLADASLNVVVVERDPTYVNASTVLSVGGLRQQFSLEENIEMSKFGAEFLRNINKYLAVEGDPPIDVHFHPYGYLTLATEACAEILKENSKLQNTMGARNALLLPSQLEQRFPWLNTDGIALGCLGLENEGWFDPWTLLTAFKRKALDMGVEFIRGEALGFNFRHLNNVLVAGVPAGEFEELNYLVVRTDDGELRPITFSKCVVAAGAFSAQIARMARIGQGKDLLSTALPVEPRKRYVFCFHAPDGPGLNFPMTIDPSGTYFRREGLANHYICGLSPPPHEEPSCDTLDVDDEYFNNKIWPILANRVKSFENLKLKSSWAGFYEFNTYDENGIVGYHPYHDNLIFATGFSGHGIQHAPAVGRAISELVEHRTYTTINLDRLSFERFITEEPMEEKNIW